MMQVQEYQSKIDKIMDQAQKKIDKILKDAHIEISEYEAEIELIDNPLRGSMGFFYSLGN